MFDGNTKAFETKPDVFSVEAVVAWLETQDPHKRYNRALPSRCLLAGYTKSMGGFFDGKLRLYRIGSRVMPVAPSQEIAMVAFGRWLGPFVGNTYGAALARARQLLSSQSR